MRNTPFGGNHEQPYRGCDAFTVEPDHPPGTVCESFSPGWPCKCVAGRSCAQAGASLDLDAEAVRLFGRALDGVADIDGCTDFRTARARLFNAPPRLLITNLRLGAYSGLHLVYVAATVALRTRSIVYADREDPFIIREAQEAGAFYESRPRLPYALPAYLCAELPARDRRNPAAFDRRRVFRGGRRAADIAIT